MKKDMSPVEAVAHDRGAGRGDPRSNDLERADSPGATSDQPEFGGHSTSMLEQTLDRTQEMIRAVDVKTALYMGIATGMAAGLPALVQAWDKSTIRTWIILVLGAAGPASCSIICGIVTFPKTDAARPSLLFFGTIARLKSREYCAQAVACTEHEYREDLAHQIHRNATIADWKYKKLKIGLRGFMIGLPFWLVAAYLLASGF